MSDLMRFACDPHLDAMTRTWVFDALRDLTGQPLGDDPAAWRAWYASVSGNQLQPHRAQRHDLASAALLQP
jgi:hypothetical protein